MSTLPPKPRTSTGDHLRPVGDDHTPLTSDDVTDPALLPRLLRLVATELHDLHAVVRGQLVPAIKRVEERQIEDARHVDEQVLRIHERIDELQTQIAVGK